MENTQICASAWYVQEGRLYLDYQSLQQALQQVIDCLGRLCEEDDGDGSLGNALEAAATLLDETLTYFDGALRPLRAASADAHAVLAQATAWRKSTESAPYPLPWNGDRHPILTGRSDEARADLRNKTAEIDSKSVGAAHRLWCPPASRGKVS